MKALLFVVVFNSIRGTAVMVQPMPTMEGCYEAARLLTGRAPIDHGAGYISAKCVANK